MKRRKEKLAENLSAELDDDESKNKADKVAEDEKDTKKE